MCNFSLFRLIFGNLIIPCSCHQLFGFSFPKLFLYSWILVHEIIFIFLRGTTLDSCAIIVNRIIIIIIVNWEIEIFDWEQLVFSWKIASSNIRKLYFLMLMRMVWFGRIVMLCTAWVYLERTPGLLISWQHRQRTKLDPLGHIRTHWRGGWTLQHRLARSINLILLT